MMMRKTRSEKRKTEASYRTVCAQLLLPLLLVGRSVDGHRVQAFLPCLSTLSRATPAPATMTTAFPSRVVSSCCSTRRLAASKGVSLNDSPDGTNKNYRLRQEQNDNDNTNDNDGDNSCTSLGTSLPDVSEAEALLACRAYLIKRRRLQGSASGGWDDWDERRKMSRDQQDWDNDGERGGPVGGFFWEDLSQLKYYRGPPDKISHKEGQPSRSTGGENHLDSSDYEVDDENILNASADAEAGARQWNPRAISLDGTGQARQGDDGFTKSITSEEGGSLWYDPEPTQEHVRRSQAAHRKFDDPDWKQKWWKQRWGRRKAAEGRPTQQQSASSSRRRRAQERLRQQVPELSQSSAVEAFLAPLASLTADEMQVAIRQYRASNARRSSSRQAWVQERTQARDNRRQFSAMEANATATHATTTSKLDRNTLLQTNTTELALQQQVRSDIARRTYQTRVERQQQQLQQSTPSHRDSIHRKSRKRSSPSPDEPLDQTDDTTSPTHALQLVQAALDKGELPQLKWVEHIVEPTRLAQRRYVLIRLLTERFDIRGKMALLAEDDPDEMPYLTERSVGELGQACLRLLRECAKS
jgi:hypothetical protein